MSEVRMLLPVIAFTEGIKDTPEVVQALEALNQALGGLSALDGVEIMGETSWEDTA